jgi:hypothetical protein
MNLGKLAGEAKKLLDKRGGIESVKEDAMELKNIAGEKGSLADKASETAAALKDPGAPGEPATPPAETPPTP